MIPIDSVPSRWRFRLVVVGLAVNTAVLVGLYLPGGYTSLRAPYTEPVFWLSFVIAFPSIALTVHTLTGKWFGRVPDRQVRELWRGLPVVVRTVLAFVCGAVVLQSALSFLGRTVTSDVVFDRSFAAGGVAASACAAAFLHAEQVRRRRGTPLPPAPARTWVSAPRIALFVVGIVGMVVFAVTNRNPIFDERATHERLAADYGHAAWYSHLVAANTYHSADGFAVYLDTTDPSIQTAACTDLLAEAKRLGRAPHLWYAHQGQGKYVRPC